MSINQWKLFIQLKDSIVKLSNDKSLQTNLSRDIVQVLQKLPATFNTKDIIKYFDTVYNNTNNKQGDSTAAVENGYLPGLYQGIKEKISGGKDEKPKQTIPKWKQPSSHLQSSIFATTRNIILSIQTAESDHSILRLIEHLLEHIQEYPEARNNAVKMGAIRMFLRLSKLTSNSEIEEYCREGLALLGYTAPVPQKGIRILSIDGGGIRGLLVLEMLKRLEELTGKKVHELFDFFCGVSTGAILSYSMAIHQKPLDEISTRYQSISRDVFKQSAIWGTGSLVLTHSYYDTSLWEKNLKFYLGDEKLISTARKENCPKICSVSAVVNQSHLSAYLFRNYNLPWRYQSQYLGSCSNKVWEAARASSAAPTYFDEFKLGNLIHQDGGILVNNPTAIALHEVKLLWPDTPIQCVVSFGTGRTVPIHTEKKDETSNNTSWTNKFLKILDSATDTEAVHTMLNDLLPPNVYYRFNPYLTEMISMVETDPKKLEQLKRDAMMYLRRNEDKFHEAANALIQEKSYMQKVKDYVNLQRDVHGI